MENDVVEPPVDGDVGADGEIGLSVPLVCGRDFLEKPIIRTPDLWTSGHDVEQGLESPTGSAIAD